MIRKTIFQLIALSFILLSCKEGDSMLSVPEIKSQFVNKDLLMPTIPSNINFAGEKIILGDWDLKERLDREILSIKHNVGATTLILKKTRRYFPLMDSILKAHNLPLDLKYVAVAESGLANVTSPAGAAGFWQFMEPTAKEYGLLVNEWVDERLDVYKSTVAAANYFHHSASLFQDWPTRITAYNRGMAGVQNALEDQKTELFFDTYLNQESSRYFFRILAYKIILENPADYGFHLTDYDYYYPIHTKSLWIDASVGNLKLWAIEQGINYKILRTLNPWIIKDILPKGIEFKVDLPIDSSLKPYKS